MRKWHSIQFYFIGHSMFCSLESLFFITNAAFLICLYSQVLASRFFLVQVTCYVFVSGNMLLVLLFPNLDFSLCIFSVFT